MLANVMAKESESKCNFERSQRDLRERIATEFLKPFVVEGMSEEARLAKAHLAWTFADALVKTSGYQWNGEVFNKLRQTIEGEK